MENMERNSISLISWHLNQAKYARGGDFVSFYSARARSFAMESCPRGGDFDEKISDPGVSRGGMVTGQIDEVILH